MFISALTSLPPSSTGIYSTAIATHLPREGKPHIPRINQGPHSVLALLLLQQETFPWLVCPSAGLRPSPHPARTPAGHKAVFARQCVLLGSPKLAGEVAGDCSPITISGIRAAASSSGKRMSLDSLLLTAPRAALPTAAQHRGSASSCLNAVATEFAEHLCVP